MGDEPAAAQTAAPSVLPGVLGYLVATKPTAAMRRLAAGYALGDAAWRIGKRWMEKRTAASSYTVTVDENDDIYPLLHRWLLAMIPTDERKSLHARTARNRIVHVGDGPSYEDELQLFYDGSKEQHVEIGGHRVAVAIERSQGRIDPGGGEGMTFEFGRAKVMFTARSVDGREAVLAFLDEVVKENRQSGPRLLIAARWGGWSQRTELPLRQLDTVVLRAGVVEELAGDLEWFLQAEADYAKLGLPWHRGYLLHGPPGTGKTSVARAIATHFGIDVYYVPLSDMSEDTQLLQLFAEVSPRSMLLLEDIDVAHAAKERDDATTRKQVSLSGLLNALDGVATPHGMITVMTTNDRSVLDPALIRPGRADRQVELDFLDDDQARRLIALMLGRVPAWVEDLGTVDGAGIAPSDVIEAIGPPGARPDAEQRLRALLEERLDG